MMPKGVEQKCSDSHCDNDTSAEITMWPNEQDNLEGTEPALAASKKEIIHVEFLL
jgi:hypothetical protein